MATATTTTTRRRGRDESGVDVDCKTLSSLLLQLERARAIKQLAVYEQRRWRRASRPRESAAHVHSR